MRKQGVIDLQLIENEARRGKRFLHRLAKCIREDSTLSKARKKTWEDIKEKGRRLSDPERGDSCEVFNERPLREDVKNYCEQDVRCMPDQYEVYSVKLGISFAPSSNWYGRISSKTAQRLKESMSEDYDPQWRD